MIWDILTNNDLHRSWRYIYHIDAAVEGAVLILVVLTFPETGFDRSSLIMKGHIGMTLAGNGTTEHIPAKLYRQKMAFCAGMFTRESYWRLVI